MEDVMPKGTDYCLGCNKLTNTTNIWILPKRWFPNSKPTKLLCFTCKWKLDAIIQRMEEFGTKGQRCSKLEVVKYFNALRDFIFPKGKE